LVGITTFLVGSVSALITLSSLEGRLPAIDAVTFPDFAYKKEVEISSLTFDEVGVIACGLEGRTRASSSSFRSSDGVVIDSTLLLFKTETAAKKKLKSLSANADRVIESGPYTNYWNVKLGERLLIETGGSYTLVTFTPAKTSFNVSTLTSQSLEHLVEFDRQSESLRRSFEINRLNP
jgi:hypothetical protein